MTMLKVIAGPTPPIRYSRHVSAGRVGAMPDGVRLGVPAAGQRLFFGDKDVREGL